MIFFIKNHNIITQNRKTIYIYASMEFQISKKFENFEIFISKNDEKHHTDLNRNFGLKSYGFLTRNLNNHICKMQSVKRSESFPF